MPIGFAGTTTGAPHYARTFLRALGWAPVAATRTATDGVRHAAAMPEGQDDE